MPTFVPSSLRRRVTKPIRALYRFARACCGRTPPLTVWRPGTDARPLKRALVSYTTPPFLLSRRNRRSLQFSNAGIARTLVQVLNDMGYVVDIVDWDDQQFRPARPYDLFVGHGGRNYEGIARALGPDTAKVYFATTLYWREQNRRAEQRLWDLEQRRGVRLPPDRLIADDEDFANGAADGIVCLGNETAKASFHRFPLVIPLNNGYYSDPRRQDVTRKDFADCRDHFLFFSSTGNVHKGLDLLLEAFARTDAHLHICQNIAPEFRAVYRHELEDLPNIHFVGYTVMRSPAFYRLMDACGFLIHPSCAEGQPGSVIECMQQGLIPILSRENNISTEDFGITLPDCSVAQIVGAVEDLRRRTPQWCRERSLRTQRAAERDYSAAGFARNMRGALTGILERRGMPKP